VIPSPRPAPINQSLNTGPDTVEPSIVVHIDIATSWHALQAIREAVYELRDTYGIYVTYEIANDAVVGASYSLGYNGRLVVEIFGRIMEIDDYDDQVDEKSYIASVRDAVVYEVLRAIGSPARSEWVASPRSTQERPSYPEAVLAAE